MLAFVGGVAAGAALYHYCYANKKESPLPNKSDQQLKSTDKVSSGTEVSVEPGMISYRLKRNTPSFKETSPAKVTSTSMVETALPYKGEVLATIN
ncbi:hypothetical protein COOONC_24095 [Cooperia oncophora]